MSQAEVVLLFSGGMDSSVLLYHLLSEGRRVAPFSICYGQRHVRELNSAATIVRMLPPKLARKCFPYRSVDLRGLRTVLSGSSQTSDMVRVPHGHYTDESMKQTVVPNRNMVLLSVAAGYAVSLGAGSVAFAAHAGDHAIYPDCRPEFADAMDAALKLSHWNPLRLERPFVDMTKAEIARRGHQLGVPLEDTWSCYQEGTLHCGRCGTCVERREAFDLAGIPDTTRYHSAG